MKETTMDKSFSTSADNLASSAENAVQRGVGQAGSALHDTIDKVADPARTTVDRAATAAHNTVDKIASGVSGVAAKVGDQAQRFTDAPLQARDHCQAYIKDHPLQAVGVALLVGMVFGRLTASRY
jgi:ElaB/YqjD/DUF883 family membrane-anchored ribosome-binding protein